MLPPLPHAASRAPSCAALAARRPTSPPASHARPTHCQSLLAGKDRRKLNTRLVLSVHIEQKQTLMGWQPQRSRPFLRVVVATPDQVAPCRSEPGGRRGCLTAVAPCPGHAA